MIIKFKPGNCENLLKFIRSKDENVEIYQLNFAGDHFLAISGDQNKIDKSGLGKFVEIEEIINGIENPYYFASKKFKTEKTIVNVGDVAIGGQEVVVIAGPCAIENREDAIATAKEVKKRGAKIFRGGVYKPRTTPYNFQGLKEKGLEIMAEVKKEVGILTITEVMDPADIDLVEKYVDILQVGSRNMTNTALLKKLGKSKKPVLIKNGFASSIQELLKAAEFIIVNGNPNIILCERGISTCETYTRNTLDLSAVVAIHELSHLPIIVDPSHGTGRKSFIEPMSKAAIAVGADGLMIEVHVDPERTIKPGDGFQTLLPDEFEKLLARLEPFLKASEKFISR